MTLRAQTREGWIEGQEERDLEVFRGIPYAAPASGPQRFQAPEPMPAWQGTRQARRFGPSSPQSTRAGFVVGQVIGVAPNAQSQDCLYLNVWTPSRSGRRPVMVWIHGGAFVMGSASTRIYWGDQLARHGDVVVVTINYRLGAMGFLNARELESGSERRPANLGIRDQIAALEWVQRNIEAFGGDPERVTVFGESAGGMSVGTLLGTPATRGLFQRAILQSGATRNVSTPERGAEVASYFLEALGLKKLEWGALEQMRVAELLEAQRKTSFALGMADGRLPFQPCIDGDLLPRCPRAEIGAGGAAEVAVLVGSNREEWRLFALGDLTRRGFDGDHLRRRLRRTMALEISDPSRAAAKAEEAYEVYREARGSSTRLRPRERWVEFQSDRIFHYPAKELADLHSGAGGRTWAYRFDWKSPVLGACHGVELPFVFGTLRDPLLRPFLGFGRGVHELSERVQHAWTHFAHAGDPRHETLPSWPQYDSERRSTLLLNRRCRLAERLRPATMQFWESALAPEEAARRAG